MLIRDDRLYLSLASISKVCLAHWVDSGIEKHRYNTCRRYEMKLSQAKILISSEYQSDVPLATQNHHSIKSRLYKDFSDASLCFDTFDIIQVLPSDCDSHKRFARVRCAAPKSFGCNKFQKKDTTQGQTINLSIQYPFRHK